MSPDSLSRFRSPSRTDDQIFSQYFTGDGEGAPAESKNNESKSTVGNGTGGDMLLQWGQRKRSRCSRTENRPAAVGLMTTTDDSSSSSSTQFHGGVKKVHRRVVVVVDKQKKVSTSGGINTNANIMPPPPPSLVPCSNGRGGNLKPPYGSKDTIAFSPNW